MAGSVNKVILVGNLGRDPEVRMTQSNQKIVQLSLATSERWKDRQSGDARERTEWHRVVIFNEHLAEMAVSVRLGPPCAWKADREDRRSDWSMKGFKDWSLRRDRWRKSRSSTSGHDGAGRRRTSVGW
jgi:hypothetical protein